MKIIVMTLYVLILIAVAGVSYVLGVGNPKIVIMEIDSEILSEAFELHGISQAILNKAENGEAPYLFFYQGMKRIDNPNGLRACLFFSNSLKSKYASDWLDKKELTDNEKE